MENFGVKTKSTDFDTFFRWEFSRTFLLRLVNWCIVLLRTCLMLAEWMRDLGKGGGACRECPLISLNIETSTSTRAQDKPKKSVCTQGWLNTDSAFADTFSLTASTSLCRKSLMMTRPRRKWRSCRLSTVAEHRTATSCCHGESEAQTL